MLDGQSSGSESEQLAGTVVLLATAVISVQVGLNLYPCRAMCDPGSQMNLMTRRCARRIRARIGLCNRFISGIGNKSGITLTHSVVVSMRARCNSKFVFTSEFTVIDELVNQLPGQALPAMVLPSGIDLADPEYNLLGEIDMLLGAGIWSNIVGSRMYRSPVGTLVQETDFGYVVLGRIPVQSMPVLASAVAVQGMPELEQENVSDASIAELNTTLKQFWEMEELEGKRVRSYQEELVEQIFVNKHKRMADGRYQVDIPIRPDAKPLGSSRETAMRRFLWMEKRLERDSALQVQYAEFMREYEQLGHMRAATRPPSREGITYYIPHHCVTTKFRVVFDASCMTSTGRSLNDIQMVGEKLQYDLTDVIQRFRRHSIAVAGDIKKMFRQVRVNPEQLTVVTYGMSSSVHNSVRAMQQCALDNEHDYPRAARAVREDFYVDDCFTGADGSVEASQLCSDVDALLKRGGFELC